MVLKAVRLEEVHFPHLCVNDVRVKIILYLIIFHFGIKRVFLLMN